MFNSFVGFFICPFFFLLSSQPLLKALLIVGSVLSVLPFLHVFSPFHWVDYLFLMVYLGGLLILFLYFTCFMSKFGGPSWSGGLVLALFFSFFSPLVYTKSGGGGSCSLFVFSFSSSWGVLLFLGSVLGVVFAFIFFFSSSAAPMREMCG